MPTTPERAARWAGGKEEAKAYLSGRMIFVSDLNYLSLISCEAKWVPRDWDAIYYLRDEHGFWFLPVADAKAGPMPTWSEADYESDFRARSVNKSSSLLPDVTVFTLKQ